MAEEFPRGQLSTIILMCLTDTDKYGYEIIDEVLKKTGGKLSIKQPSLYSSLKRMEEQSLISSYWRDSEIGGRRHYYHLTDLGKKHLEKWQSNVTIPLNNELNSLTQTSEFDSHTKVLQQENLFSLTKKDDDKKTELVIDKQEKPSFFQYDLFAENTIITPPSTDKIVEEKQDAENSVNGIMSSNINTSEQTPTTPSIQQFNYIKKGNKSFSDTIKNITTVENKKFIIEKQQDEFSNNINNDLNNTTLYNLNTNNYQNLNNNKLQDNHDTFTKNNEVVSPDEKQDISIEMNETTESGIELDNLLTNQPINLENNSKINDNENILIDSSINDTSEFINKVNKNTLSGYINNEITHKANKNNNLSHIENNINYETEKVEDDGVLITERLDIKDFPKSPKWESRRFEIYISDDSISPKFTNKTNENYEDRIKDLYEKSKTNSENQELELIDSKLKFSSYKELQEFYNNQNIKFKPFEKTLYKSEKKFDMIRITKLHMLTNLLLFSIISVISLVLGLAFSYNKDAYINHPITYCILPLICFVAFLIALALYSKSRQKRIAFDINKFKFNFTLFALSLSSIPIIIAINLLFGFNFSNITHYIVSIIYPCLVSIIYVLYWAIQKLLTKFKILY